MPPENPLHIPEIMSMVATYLEGSDLARCLRVSKSWRHVFLPHRWRVIKRVVDKYRHFGPSRDALYKHRHLVQDLTMHTMYEQHTEFMHHPNLRRLDIDLFVIDSDVYDNRETIRWDLTEKYPLLDHLSISNVDVNPTLCRALSEHPSLKSLYLYNSEMKRNNRTVFWEACRNLEGLEMRSIDYKDRSMSVPKDAVFNRMRTLKIKDAYRRFPPLELLDLVFHCPRLESFEWDLVIPFKIRIMINHPIQKDHWPLLNELRNPREPQDTEFASIITGIGNSLGRIAELHIAGGTFGPQAFRALDFHFDTLVDLYVGEFASSISSAIRDVLCSCPNLENMQAPSIYAKDIAEGGPWLCRGLRKLVILFLVRETEQDLCPLVFERLSTLTRLTTLDMGYPIETDNDTLGSSLQFRLDCGVEQLACLQELRTVGFYSGYHVERKQQLGTKDVEWMAGNWRKLKAVNGNLNKNPEVDRQLRCVLRSHGIDTW